MQKDRQGEEKFGALSWHTTTVRVVKYFLGNAVQVEYFAESKKRGEAAD